MNFTRECGKKESEGFCLLLILDGVRENRVKQRSRKEREINKQIRRGWKRKPHYYQ